MRFFKLAIPAAAAVALMTSAATAQTLGMGTSKGGWTSQAGAAISKLISTMGGMQMRQQASAGSSVYVPQISGGQLEFGLANEQEARDATTGTGIYKGRAQPDLRVAAVLSPFRVAIFSKKGSDIKMVSDLKGKRVPSGWASQKIIQTLMDAELANAGLTYDDVVKVPTANVVGSANDFAAGKVDVFFFVLTAGKVKETDAKVGGIQVVGIDSSPAAVKRMQKFLPPSYAMALKPSPALVGVTGPVNVMAYDYLMLTNAMVPADTVYKVLKTIATHKSDLVKTFPGMALFDPKRLSKNIPNVKFHDGAIKYMKEVGQWPPKG
jgi:TRAP transporter TAXI family solute receptor